MQFDDGKLADIEMQVVHNEKELRNAEGIVSGITEISDADDCSAVTYGDG